MSKQIATDGELAQGYIYVHGVRIKIPLRDMQRGDSFFVPCVNTKHVANQIKRMGGLFNMSFYMRQKVEKDYYGLRVWRKT